MKEASKPQLIVMLTHNDMTVANAADVFEACRESHAQYWGMKESPLPLPEMQSLYEQMRSAGKNTVMEIVAYDEAGGLKGAEKAAACGCEILMGTKFHESIANYCHSRGMRYYPFVGTISGRPSVLSGSAEEMIAEARHALANGADGIDLLGYRYVGDARMLNNMLVAAIEAPVVLAGSIDSYRRLDEVAEAAPWGFTIGSAFFNHKFGADFSSQIDSVVNYISNPDTNI